MTRYATGWLQDPYDPRDFDAGDIIKALPFEVGKPPPGDAAAPSQVDQRSYCSPVENQGPIGSCTAQAVAGLVEFQERVRYRKHIDVSRLFLYKVARQLDGLQGDSGAHIRTAMKGLKLFGAPPERYWPYRVKQFDRHPGAFVYCYGQSLQAISYWRLDIPDRTRGEVLSLAKSLIAVRSAIAFGFRVYSYGDSQGQFPMPEAGQSPQGGHAVLAVGYDDARRIGDSVGALLIRNSWGRDWGDGGYGWLPYGYVLERLAWDFWTLTRKETLV